MGSPVESATPIFPTTTPCFLFKDKPYFEGYRNQEVAISRGLSRGLSPARGNERGGPLLFKLGLQVGK